MWGELGYISQVSLLYIVRGSPRVFYLRQMCDPKKKWRNLLIKYFRFSRKVAIWFA